MADTLPLIVNYIIGAANARDEGERMRIEHMREFIAVAEAGNITAASELLYVAQPVLSKHLQGLERELNATLFARTTRGVSLTPPGECAYSAFEQIVSLCDDLTMCIDGHREQETGIVRIGMLNMGFDRYIAPVVTQIKRTFPSIEIKYVTEKPIEITRMLESEELDVGFFAGSIHNAPRGLDTILIGRESVLIALPKAHPAAEKAALQPDDLSQSALICLKNQETTRTMNNLLFSIGIKPSDILAVDELELVPFSLEQTNSFFAIPEFMADRFISNPSLVAIPMAEPLYNDIFFAYRKTNRNPALWRFLDIEAALSHEDEGVRAHC